LRRRCLLRLCASLPKPGKRPIMDSTGNPVASQPQVRASFKKDPRFARAQNGAFHETTQPTMATASPSRRVERHSLQPAHNNGGLNAVVMNAAKPPTRTKKTSHEGSIGSAGLSRSATQGGRQYAVGNIGGGGRIYLRYLHTPFVTSIPEIRDM
jgi:hypothetical protein